MKKFTLIIILVLLSVITFGNINPPIEVRKAIPIYKVKPYELSKVDISANINLKTIEPNFYKMPEIYYEPNNKKYKIKLELANCWIKKDNGAKNPVGLQISIEY